MEMKHYLAEAATDVRDMMEAARRVDVERGKESGESQAKL
jgi:hypothetical protein